MGLDSTVSDRIFLGKHLQDILNEVTQWLIFVSYVYKEVQVLPYKVLGREIWCLCN